MAALQRGLSVDDSFRVIGDDIIMMESMQGAYNQLVACMGGEINLTKTITSDQIAEFAGRIIEPNRHYLKTIKFSDPSDNSFMEVMSSLAPQAKGCLRPRQLDMWERFKHVPGIIIDGPWSHDSFGIPLEQRYNWYLNSSGLSIEKFEPDASTLPFEQELLLWQMSNIERPATEYLPWPVEEDYLSSLVDRIPKRHSMDPTLYQGKTQLERLEEVALSPNSSPFQPDPSPESPLQLEIDRLKLERDTLAADLSSVGISHFLRVLKLDKQIVKLENSVLGHIPVPTEKSAPSKGRSR
jgi:hypothetical protein